ncbi:MAG TPA: iron-sulfur cluster insertion protein ErpA [Stellaceae bacterium]|nr:iron-sulfur cluster insertion protein ErpA [Stellaceae bacterium]
MPEGGNVIEGRSVGISESASRRVAYLIAQEPVPGTFLRIAVSGGGCSGFQYGFTFETERQNDDHVFERDGAVLVVDETSLDLMNGAELDFIEEMAGSSFQIRNPNATSSCGCGSSFAV